MNLKKTLLAGSALAVFSFALPHFAQAADRPISGSLQSSDMADGDRLVHTAGNTSLHIDPNKLLRLGNPADGTAAIDISGGGAGMTIYVASSTGVGRSRNEVLQKSLILQGNSSGTAINLGLNQTTLDIYMGWDGQYDTASTHKNVAHIRLEGNIAATQDGSVRFFGARSEWPAQGVSGSRLEFATGADNINLGANGKVLLSRSIGGVSDQDEIIFSGANKQEFTGPIEGDGLLIVNNTSADGVILHSKVDLEDAHISGKANFKNQTKITDVLMVNSAGNAIFDGAADIKTITVHDNGKLAFNNNVKVLAGTVSQNAVLDFKGQSFNITGTGNDGLGINGVMNFNGSAAQSISGNISGSGAINIDNASGVTFSDLVQSNNMTVNVRENGKVDFAHNGASSVTSLGTVTIGKNAAATFNTSLSLKNGISGYNGEKGAVILKNVGAINSFSGDIDVAQLRVEQGHTNIDLNPTKNLKVMVSDETFVADGSSLTINNNASTFNKVNLSDSGKSIFDHNGTGAQGIVISGAVEGGTNSQIRNGSGDLTLSGSSSGKGTIVYDGAGTVNLHTTSPSEANINFNNQNGTLKVAADGTVTGNITAGNSKAGVIVLNGKATFDGTIGGKSQDDLISAIRINDQTTFNQKIYVDQLTSSGTGPSSFKLKFNADANINKVDHIEGAQYVIDNGAYVKIANAALFGSATAANNLLIGANSTLDVSSTNSKIDFRGAVKGVENNGTTGKGTLTLRSIEDVNFYSYLNEGGLDIENLNIVGKNTTLDILDVNAKIMLSGTMNIADNLTATIAGQTGHALNHVSLGANSKLILGNQIALPSSETKFSGNITGAAGSALVSSGNNVSVQGNISANYDFSGMASTLTLTGNNQTVSGNIISGGNNVGNVTTQGKTIFSGNIGASGAGNAIAQLNLGGEATFGGDVYVANLVHNNRDLRFTGTTHLAQDFITTGGVTLDGGNAKFSANKIEMATLVNASGTNKIQSDGGITVSGNTTVTGGELQILSNANLQNIVLGGNTITFDTEGATAAVSTVSGDVTASAGSKINIGLADVTFNGTSVQSENFTFMKNGKVTLANSVTGNIGSVTFNAEDAEFIVGSGVTAMGPITASTNGFGKISTAAAMNINASIGAENLAVKQVTLGGDTVFTGALYTQNLNAGNHALEMRGIAHIADGLTTTGTLSVGGAAQISGGDLWVGGLIAKDGTTHINSKLGMVNAGLISVANNAALHVNGAGSSLANVTLAQNASLFMGAGNLSSIIGDAKGSKLILTADSKASQNTFILGSVGTVIARLSEISISGDGNKTTFVGSDVYTQNIRFDNAGDLLFAAQDGTYYTGKIDFNNKVSTVTYGAGAKIISDFENGGSLNFGNNTKVTGNIGAANKAVTNATFTGSATVSGNIYAGLVNVNGGDLVFDGGVFNGNLNFSSDHKVTLTNTQEFTGNISADNAGTGFLEFTKGMGSITGSINTRLREFQLSQNATITGGMVAANENRIDNNTLTVDGAFTASEHSTLHFTVDGQGVSGQIKANTAAIHADTAVKVTVANDGFINNDDRFTLIDGAAGNTGIVTLSAGKLSALNTALITFAQDTNNTEDLILIAQRAAIGGGGNNGNGGNGGTGGGGNAGGVTGGSSNNAGQDNIAAIGSVLDALKNNGNVDIDTLQSKLSTAKDMQEVHNLVNSVITDQTMAAVQSTVATSTATNNAIGVRLLNLIGSAPAASANASSGFQSGVMSGVSSGNMSADRHFWMQGFASRSDQGMRSGIAGYDAKSYGGVAGVDVDAGENTRIGVAFSYGDTTVKSDDINRTRMDIDSYQLSMYGMHDLGSAVFITGQAGFAYNDIAQTRHNVGLVAGNNAQADYNSTQYVARAEIGRIFAAEKLKITPSVHMNYNHINIDGYSENGANGLNLQNVKTDKLNILEFGMNILAEGDFVQDNGHILRPYVNAGYRHDVIGDNVATTAALAGGGTAFTTQGAEPARGTLNIGGGLTWEMPAHWDITVNYDYESKSDYDAHSGYVRFGYRF